MLKEAINDIVSKTINSFGYHISGAMYLDGVRETGEPAEGMVHIVVEKKAPFLSNPAIHFTWNNSADTTPQQR